MFIDDTTGVLTESQKDVLNNLTSKADVKIVIVSTSSRSELDATVHNLVNTPNTLAIGLDPTHRFTNMHFGSGLGVPSSEFNAIRASGNSEFKQGHWAAGLETIIKNADAEIGLARMSTQIATTPVIVQQPVIEHPVSAVPFVVGGLFILATVILMWRWIARRQQRSEAEARKVVDGFREEADELRSRNIKEAAYYSKIESKDAQSTVKTAGVPIVRQREVAAAHKYIPPVHLPRSAPATTRQVANLGRPHVTVVNNGSNSNDLALGIAIGQMSTPRVVERVVERSSTPAPSRSSSYDSGSSSSSYDSGSSSSWDSGSSSGGFDSGGGGFDGGSSGGDF